MIREIEVLEPDDVTRDVEEVIIEAMQRAVVVTDSDTTYDSIELLIALRDAGFVLGRVSEETDEPVGNDELDNDDEPDDVDQLEDPK